MCATTDCDAIRIIDFGLAFVGDKRTDGAWVGTPRYMPEDYISCQKATCHEEHSLDHLQRLDVFALGAMFFFILFDGYIKKVGNFPFALKNWLEIDNAKLVVKDKKDLQRHFGQWINSFLLTTSEYNALLDKRKGELKLPSRRHEMPSLCEAVKGFEQNSVFPKKTRALIC